MKRYIYSSFKYQLFLSFVFFCVGSAKLQADGISKALIQKYLPEGAIIIEAGAHVGIDTAEMAGLWPKAKIYAFEPVPNLFRELQARTKNFKNVACFSCALSNESGHATFYISSGTSDGSSSLLQPQEHLNYHPTVLFNQAIEVQTLTLDDWAKKNGIHKADALWLDMQGSELDMLKASPQILKTVKVIHTEVSIIELYKGAPLYPEVRAWLESQGFKVACEYIPWKDAGNVLFVRE